MNKYLEHLPVETPVWHISNKLKYFGLSRKSSSIPNLLLKNNFQAVVLTCHLQCAHVFSIIFGLVNLRKGVSGAKVEAEADFEVGFAVAPQKPIESFPKQYYFPKFLPT